MGVLADTTQAPVAGWLFEVGSYVMWVGIFAVLLIDSLRRHRVNPWLIYLFAFTTMFWLDFYGGWGGYFLYNKRFALMEWWGTSQWTSPNKPWWGIVSYGWWWTFAIGLSSIWLARLRRARPNWSLPLAFALTCGVFFYVYDVVVESIAVRLNWWDYTMGDPFGLQIDTSGGSFPLIWPILPQIVWIYAVICLVTLRNSSGALRFESWLGIDRLSGARLQVSRFFAFAVAFNVTYAVILIIPMMLVRAVQGDPSTLVP